MQMSCLVDFQETNGPKDSVFSFSYGACIVVVCSSLTVSRVRVGMKICWLKSNWEKWRGKKRKLNKMLD